MLEILMQFFYLIRFIGVVIFSAVFYKLIRKNHEFKNKLDAHAFFLLVKVAPKTRSVCLRLGETLGGFCYRLGMGKKKVMSNLRIAFGKTRTPEEIERLAVDVYRFSGSVVMELIYFHRIEKSEVEDMMVLENPEIVEEMRAVQQENGLFVLSAHCGNLDFTNYLLSIFFENFHALVVVENPLIRAFLAKLRNKFGGKRIQKTAQSGLTIMKVLKKKGAVGMVGDLNTSKPDRFVPFFGELASVPRGIYYLPMRAKSEVYFVCTLRRPDNRYLIRMRHIPYDKGADFETQSEEIVKGYLGEVEAAVNEYPEQFLWFNPRWKTRPPGDDRDFYA